MTPEEYKKWRPTYSKYEKNYPVELDMNVPFPQISGVGNKTMTQFLATTGLASEAAELMSVTHKAFRNKSSIDMDKAKDEASDVWWYLNMCLDAFGWTLEELSEHNRAKLDERNKT